MKNRPRRPKRLKLNRRAPWKKAPAFSLTVPPFNGRTHARRAAAALEPFAAGLHQLGEAARRGAAELQLFNANQEARRLMDEAEQAGRPQPAATVWVHAGEFATPEARAALATLVQVAAAAHRRGLLPNEATRPPAPATLHVSHQVGTCPSCGSLEWGGGELGCTECGFQEGDPYNRRHH